jgi:hypothetical protein
LYVPGENRYDELVGVNCANSAICPVVANDVVVVATPLTFTATGDPMFVPLASNCTIPAGFVPSAADVSAVSVTVVPAFAGFGDALRLTVVVTGDPAASAADPGTQTSARAPGPPPPVPRSIRPWPVAWSRRVLAPAVPSTPIPAALQLHPQPTPTKPAATPAIYKNETAEEHVSTAAPPRGGVGPIINR